MPIIVESDVWECDAIGLSCEAWVAPNLHMVQEAFGLSKFRGQSVTLKEGQDEMFTRFQNLSYCQLMQVSSHFKLVNEGELNSKPISVKKLNAITRLVLAIYAGPMTWYV